MIDTLAVLDRPSVTVLLFVPVCLDSVLSGTRLEPWAGCPSGVFLLAGLLESRLLSWFVSLAGCL